MAGVPHGQEGPGDPLEVSPDPSDQRTSLERMLEARSVAVVGASVKTGSLGAQMMAELRRGGFVGDVYPINPGYEEVDGYRCYPSILEAPGPVDLAILGVANARIEQAMQDAIAAGAGSVVTFSSLYEEPGEGSPLTERVGALAREAGIALCGGNGMGFLNVPGRLRATGFATPDEMRAGPVTFISHSGSAFAALAFNDRGIGFDLVVSSGQEVVTTMDEYMRFALERDTSRVLALLLETVRNPAGFVAALTLAAERGIPVLALKVGRSERSKAMVTAHSGALAGEHGAYEAVFDAHGVHEVRSLDEMADALELFSSPRRVTGGTGIASIHDSGGERALFVDLAAEHDVPLADVSEATLTRIADVLDPGLEAANPLDAWGTGIDADRIFRESFVAFHDDPDVAAMAFVVDLTRQGEPYDEGYLQIASDISASTTKPFCVLSNLSAAVDQDEAKMLRDAGIPVLEGTTPGLRALKHLLEDARARRAVVPPAPAPDHVRDWWRVRLETGEPIGEQEGLRLLADYGIPTVEIRTAATAEEAIEAGNELGYPVVLKTAAPEVHHKTDAGGVRLGLGGGQELSVAYIDMAARLGPHVTVSKMAPTGVEIAIGLVHDPTFGSLVLVAAGGVFVELLADRRLGLPPLDDVAASRLIDGLRIRPVLDGVRGAAATNVAALAHAVSRLSVLAAELGDRIAELDANPVIVSPSGCVAVDALIVPRSIAS
jgi:acetate---CoA ligase (ADP-forming)